ncbi:hypothetical protein DO021_03200 [Desulfobacter hydrogenophilus]|uniref:Mechanosensitive ion channel family protein n=1 Tax=Desulfobacter hydrogenophilus TaxID=2291 RepID=A0A328FGJ0_9BACT|nr:hypothetical protein [Desulfobacter hydrogenophilus]NDY71409.1 hypothetical protein [Desulfobacter hydrogenophilus]QBH12148.1 hypothetical protein EYB58_03925 [Desulfobacter hydrogenophilus]RAM03529.1 hypothetical protein DO021_03200 [Desulfobacter hydrogenophilus]
MKKYLSLIITALILLPCIAISQENPTDSSVPGAAAQTQGNTDDQLASKAQAHQNTLEILKSIVRSKTTLKQRMDEKKQAMDKASSETEKQYLSEELAALDKQMAGAVTDFEMTATGVEIGLFVAKKKERFDWQDELLSLAEPGIMELKRLTVKARHKSKLNDELTNYQELLPVAIKARNRIESLIRQTKDPALADALKDILPEYKGLESQIKNKVDLIQLKLDEIERQEASVINSTQDSVKRFFKTRGLYLFLAILSCIGVVLLIKFLYRTLIRFVPGYKLEYRPFHIRILELVYRGITVVLTVLAVIALFYFVEDWVLLSLTIIGLLGVVWAAKHTLPMYLDTSKLMLNVGAVREGERMMYQGVPWRVKHINLHTLLENPDLGITLRIPISELIGKTSRTCDTHEAWFPCRKNDWVILSDGTRGGVTHLSHETVELVLRGGAKKTYQTADFLGMTPLNLSVNFRLKVLFGIGYGHQEDATTTIPDLLSAFIQNNIEKEGYAQDMLNLRVEFAEAGASSLDLVVIADFKGSQAPIYNRLKRSIQRWCVEAASQYNWDIPFPQITVHQEA